MSAKVLERPPLPRLILLLSLAATPTIVFLSSSNGLFLANQEELHHQLGVLFPFVRLFFFTLAAGIAILTLSKYRPARYLLCAYYVIGPYYLAFLFLQKISIGFFSFSYVFDTLAGFLVLILGFFALVIRWGPRFNPEVVARPFALLALLLLSMESYSFVTRRVPPPVPVTQSLQSREERRDLPNIYHIIFDGFQSDFFTLTLTPETSEALQGFIFFPKAKSRYELTEMSLPSIFTGSEFDRDVARADYMRRPYRSELSFLHPLREKGYQTLAYLPIGHRFGATLLDEIVFHRSNAREEELLKLNTATFQRLWLYASAPLFLTRQLMETEWFIQYGVKGDMRLMKNERFLAYSRPVASYLSFLNVLEQEPLLPAHGLYTVVHTFIPHPPDVLDADCNYGRADIQSGPLDMTRCATKLLLSFVERLEELGRFDDAFIVVHGDHGGFYSLENDRLIPSESTSRRALLLIKPVGNARPFAISESKASLMDIAPTLLEALDVDHDLEFDGAVLTEVLR